MINMTQPIIYLVCGYRRTGKDTLYDILSGAQISGLFKWRVYKNASNQYNLRSISSKYERTAFANALKEEVSEVYNIPLVISDADKDIKQFVHYKTGEVVSARDIYIEWGTIRREQDINYWCKKALNPYLHPRENPTTSVTTDWRFPNELQYAQSMFEDVVTIRVYRSDIPEPDLDIASEHSLDDYVTDYLLIRDGLDGEFEKTIQRFPQYASYVPGESI